MVWVGMAVGWLAEAAWACPVCFGDPESDMVKGAEAGVVFMLCVVYSLLLGFMGVTTFWLIRARRIRLGTSASPNDANALDSQAPVD